MYQQSSLQNRRYFCLRFLGEQGQARGKRGVRVTGDGRGAKKITGTYD